jgi:hypothetical protein
MDAENSKPRLKQQIESLRSSNRTAILSTLKDLRSDGDVSVLSELFQLLLVQEDREIQDEIAALLNDLKDQEAVVELADAIVNPEYQEIQSILVAACWQNGLSYGKHISAFVEVLISGEYAAAIEAFTVIEESIGELEQVERKKLASSMKSQLRAMGEQKKALLLELVKVIESY